MKREIWHSRGEEEHRKDSLYIAAEILKEYVKTDQKVGNADYLLEKIYSKLEELRKKG